MDLRVVATVLLRRRRDPLGRRTRTSNPLNCTSLGASGDIRLAVEHLLLAVGRVLEPHGLERQVATLALVAVEKAVVRVAEHEDLHRSLVLEVEVDARCGRRAS